MARSVTAPQEVITRVRELVDRTSISETGRKLCLAEATVARLAGGLPVAPGTVLWARQQLLELNAPSDTEQAIR